MTKKELKGALKLVEAALSWPHSNPKAEAARVRTLAPVAAALRELEQRFQNPLSDRLKNLLTALRSVPRRLNISFEDIQINGYGGTNPGTTMRLLRSLERRGLVISVDGGRAWRARSVK